MKCRPIMVSRNLDMIESGGVSFPLSLVQEETKV